MPDESSPPAAPTEWIRFNSATLGGPSTYLRRDAITGVIPEGNSTSSILADGIRVIVGGDVESLYALIRQ